MFDTRQQFHVNKFQFHNQEICGLTWSPDGTYFASGGNENKAYVFCQRMNMPLMKMSHKAAIRAIDWSPHHRGLLATGGGTADQKLKIWNTRTNSLVNEIHTKS